MAAEEDPFSEFLSQDQASGAPAEQVPSYAAAPAAAEVSADTALRIMAESAQRQEQLLSKVCSLLVGLDEKMGRMASNQEKMEATMQRLMENGAAAMSAAGGDGRRPSVGGGGPRGNLVLPPGKAGNAAAAYGPGGVPSAPSPVGPSFEDQQRQQERLAAERARVEEENRRRAAELQRQREEAERRRQEEEERKRLEMERKLELERQKKEELANKTNSLMSNLISNSGGGGLFEDDAPKKSKAGLFDD
eukprot:TRINITY_DN11718_c1_g1_i1.p1 TRINITY_DN11718_c1_g1~~TRINITY_DN11718_c1_g1_i1.p1  ORF type:complete len:248 (+),score=94.29 TRINITY_DN11718_c1_g1_i1:64-807(+)